MADLVTAPRNGTAKAIITDNSTDAYISEDEYPLIYSLTD